MPAQKFVALYDIHVGWEKARQGDNLVTVPTHNEAALNLTKAFMDDFKPDVVLLGGDQINCGPISHWNKDKKQMVEGLRLVDELNYLNKEVLLFIDGLKPKRKIYHVGNHEAWINQFVEENPSIEGMIEPEDYLRLKARKYEIFSQGEISNIGKLFFVHGDIVLARGGMANPARRLVDAYRRNIRAGHLHTYCVYTEVTPIDKQDYHTGMIVPALASRAPYYTKYNPSNFMNGFLWGWVWPDGDFSDYCTIINRNQATINGKLYKG